MGPTLRINADVPPKLRFLFKPPLGSVRWRVAHGGRGGAKSWNFARALLIHSMGRIMRVLCAREYQSSIRDSVHKLLQEQAAEIGAGPWFDVQRTIIRGRNGSEFLFHGIKRDPHKIKSIEGIDVCWVEEAEAVSEESWTILTPTIRKPGSEIWVSFNPFLRTDPTWVRLVERPPRRSIVRAISYLDNPFLPNVLAEEAEEMRERDPEGYEYVWGGQPWHRSEAEVLGGMWRVDDFTPGEGWSGPYFGADWGFSSDPTATGRCWIHAKRLFIEYDERSTRLSMDQTARLLASVPGAGRHRIWCDSARPETINEMILRRLSCEAAPKWPGSVEDGIDFFRGFEEIIIHPRAKGWIQDAKLWRYKTDAKTGDVLPALMDGYDHGPDWTRYALHALIRKRPGPRIWYPGMEEGQDAGARAGAG